MGRIPPTVIQIGFGEIVEHCLSHDISVIVPGGVCESVMLENDVPRLAAAVDGLGVFDDPREFRFVLGRMQDAFVARQVIVVRNPWLIVLHEEGRVEAPM